VLNGSLWNVMSYTYTVLHLSCSRHGLCSHLSLGMASKAIRRRPIDKGSGKLTETTMPDSATEPLLGNNAQGSKPEVSNGPLSSLNLRL
jgi:hypothetical protein